MRGDLTKVKIRREITRSARYGFISFFRVSTQFLPHEITQAPLCEIAASVQPDRGTYRGCRRMNFGFRPGANFFQIGDWPTRFHFSRKHFHA